MCVGHDHEGPYQVEPRDAARADRRPAFEPQEDGGGHPGVEVHPQTDGVLPSVQPSFLRLAKSKYHHLFIYICIRCACVWVERNQISDAEMMMRVGNVQAESEMGATGLSPAECAHVVLRGTAIFGRGRIPQSDREELCAA